VPQSISGKEPCALIDDVGMLQLLVIDFRPCLLFRFNQVLEDLLKDLEQFMTVFFRFVLVEYLYTMQQLFHCLDLIQVLAFEFLDQLVEFDMC